MSEKQAITEEQGVHKAWYDEAKKQTVATLPEFIRKLTEDYGHDYGTICHAIAAAGLAAMHAVDASPTGGITGFQASCIIWEVIGHWGSFTQGPKRMVCYHDMLFPQHAGKFEKTLSPDTWEYLQDEARKMLSDETVGAHPNVQAHWDRIANGIVPFGYAVAPKGGTP